MELTMVHLLTICMILIANSHGVPTKNKIIGKLSAVFEEASHADTSNIGDSRLISFVNSRSKRSSDCSIGINVLFLDPNLRKNSTNGGFISHITEEICTCCSDQKFVYETVCLWQNNTCTAYFRISVRKGCK